MKGFAAKNFELVAWNIGALGMLELSFSVPEVLGYMIQDGYIKKGAIEDAIIQETGATGVDVSYCNDDKRSTITLFYEEADIEDGESNAMQTIQAMRYVTEGKLLAGLRRATYPIVCRKHKELKDLIRRYIDRYGLVIK